MTCKASDPSEIVVDGPNDPARRREIVAVLADGEALAMAYRAMYGGSASESLALSMPTPTMLQALRMLGHAIAHRKLLEILQPQSSLRSRLHWWCSSRAKEDQMMKKMLLKFYML